MTTSFSIKNMNITRDIINKLNDEKQIRMVDSDQNGLELFSKVNWENTTDENVNKCRGTIFKEGELVLRSYPHTNDITLDKFEIIEKDVLQHPEKCSYYNAYEGAMIRIFNHSDIWYISTNKKLDAFTSKWASKESFGYNFLQAIENELSDNPKFAEFLGTENVDKNALERLKLVLNKDHQYMFLLLNNTENRLVSASPEKPTVFHIGTFIGDEIVLDNNIGIRSPERHEFPNIDAVYDYIDRADYKKYQGLMIFTPTNIFKVYNPDYYKLLQVRGNESSIKYRYLQIRRDTESINIIHYLFPEHSNDFDDYEKFIGEIAQYIYDSYVNRFIRKQYINVPVEEFGIMKKCHEWHSEDRYENRISIDKVLDFLNNESPTSINRMIRHLKLEKNKKLNPDYEEPIAGNPQQNTYFNNRGGRGGGSGRGGGRGGGPRPRQRLLPRNVEKVEVEV